MQDAALDLAGLAGPELEQPVAEAHRGPPADDEPVLVAAGMSLQGQGSSGIELDLADPEPRPLQQGREAPPGPDLPGVADGLAPPGPSERRDELFDCLTIRAVGDEDRIRGLDHGEPADPGESHEAMVGLDEIVSGNGERNVTRNDVAVLVLRHELPERMPGADVRPARIAGNDRHPRGTFHHRLVDRQGRQASEQSGIDDALRVRPMARFEGLELAGEYGLEPGELVEQNVGTHDEHAAVPVVPARRQHGFGFGTGRLLDETADGESARSPERFAPGDPAEARLRAGRGDAEGDDPPRCGERQRPLERADQRLRLANEMVGGADPENGVARDPGRCVARGEPHGCGRVARFRLEHEMAEQSTVDLGELTSDQDGLAGGRDGHHPLGRRDPEDPASGRLQEGFVAHELDEMFGKSRAAHRPQAGPRATGQEDRDERAPIGYTVHGRPLRKVAVCDPDIAS